MVWVSTRWFKTGRRGIARFVSISIVSLLGFICTVSAGGAPSSPSRGSSPEYLASASDVSPFSKHGQGGDERRNMP